MNTYIYKLLYNNLHLHLRKYAFSLVWINSFGFFYALQYLHTTLSYKN